MNREKEEEEEAPILYYGKGRVGTTINDKLFLLVLRLFCDCAWSGHMSNWHFESRLIPTPPICRMLSIM